MRKNRESKEERKNLKNEEIRLSPLKIWDCDKKFRPSRGFPSGWLSSNYWFIHFPKAKKSRGGSGEEANRIHETLRKLFLSSLLSSVLKWSESKQWAVKWSSHPHLVRLAFLRTRDSKMRIDRRRKNYGWIHIAKIWYPAFLSSSKGTIAFFATVQ